MAVIVGWNLRLPLGPIHAVHVSVYLAIIDRLNDLVPDGMEQPHRGEIIDVVSKDADVFVC